MQKVLACLVLLAAFTACQPSREKLNERITATEKRLFSPNSSGFSKASADSLIADYELFVREYPKDTLAPVYLFKGAGISMNMGEGGKAIELYDRMISTYPDHPKAALALFFKGYVQENLLKDLDKAKETYLLFIEKYPNNEFTDDAQASINNLGKSPEQMIREFEARKKADSAAITGKK